MTRVGNMDANAQGTRLRKAAVDVNPSAAPQKGDSNIKYTRDVDPYAEPPRSAAMQYFRVVLFGIFFTVCCFLYAHFMLMHCWIDADHTKVSMALNYSDYPYT